MKKMFFCAALIALLGACDKAAPTNKGFYMLLDTSGTYSEELRKAEQLIRYTLTRLDAADSFAVARIDTGSFNEKDIIAKVSFDDRPTAINRQKRLFAEKISKFINTVKSAKYTDITGGILQAVEFLNEKNTGEKTIFIFSDMKEDIQAGFIRDIEFNLDGYRVIALNVTKLNSDNVDPREYISRLDMWQSRIESAGGTWKVINDLDGFEKLFQP